MHTTPGFAMSMRFVLAGSLVAAAILPAAAADYSHFDYQPSYSLRPAVHDWSGGYAGIHGGWSWSKYSAKGATPDYQFSKKHDGGVLGLQTGYGVQMDELYLGIEADISYLDRQMGGGIPISLSSRWQGSFRGRLGVAWDDILLYATGGLAVAPIKFNGEDLAKTETSVGWIAGAGAEWRISDNWSARGEYLYSSFREKFPAEPIKADLDSHVVRAGLNYRFGE